MATAAIVLFNIQFNVHAETLEVSEGETVTVSGKPIIHFMQKGSKIIGKDLEIIH
ncbi:autotransporter [Bartonella henselae]|uniref:Autotransporter n=1 Tax=Bartonella henselae TaxID=38323 RepID=X5M0D5_BARHN|nr:autotransporter [Bartonella henselae]